MITVHWSVGLIILGIGYILGNWVAISENKRGRAALTAQFTALVAREEARADTLAQVVAHLTGSPPADQADTPTGIKESAERPTG